MKSLENMYPSLSLFSDIDWKSIDEEYQTQFSHISFPEYLQEKALEGDCPLYLFELAFYEYAKHELQNLTAQKSGEGYHLNPTTLFLSLEFDITRMLKEAQTGHIDIHERPHVLCLYKNQNGEVCSYEVCEQNLAVLGRLEEGPLGAEQFNPEEQKIISQLAEKGLIL